MKTISIFVISGLLFIQSIATASEVKLCKEAKTDCTFVLLNDNNDQLTVVNKQRANQALSPFSTFKIANSLIGLDLQIIDDAKQPLTYDKSKYPTQPWWPPVWKLPSYNLANAYQFSMVPIYRQLASDIGEKNMKRYLKNFHYGNQDISTGIDDFWLNGSLKTSAVEQVKFLQKLHRHKLGLSDQTYQTMKQVMLVESTDEYKIYAKTGAGKVEDGSMLGWYVGYVEGVKGVHYFAMNFNRKTYAEMKKDRMNMAMNHLKQLKIIDTK
ncbi:penicillin-binding transpeptidase domain-containing protein [Colwelliaceae bacterium 6441]